MMRTEAWWNRRNPMQKAFIQWSVPLILFAIVVGARLWWLEYTNEVGPLAGRTLLLNTGYVLACTVVVMFIGTRRWTLLMLGLFGLLTAFSAILIRIIGRQGPSPGDTERNLIQALIEVGAMTAFLGAIVWVIFSRFGTRREM